MHLLSRTTIQTMKIYKVIDPQLYNQLMALKQQGAGETIGVNTQHTAEPIVEEHNAISTQQPATVDQAAPIPVNEETLPIESQQQVGAGQKPVKVHQCISAPDQQWISFEEFSAAK